MFDDIEHLFVEWIPVLFRRLCFVYGLFFVLFLCETSGRGRIAEELLINTYSLPPRFGR